jgi:nitrogen fixation NifU-like protein
MDTGTVKEEDIYRMIANPEPEKEATQEPEHYLVSPEVQRRALDPPLLGEISVPDGYAHVTGDCGDSMEVFLAIQDRRIREARFDTLGCGFTLACGSMAMEMAEGETVSDAMQIDARKITLALGGLPGTHEHCAELAVETLKKAIKDYLFRGNESWKKLYRNR